MTLRVLLIPLVVSLLATASRAQPQDLAFERILTGRALEIAQDHEGFLWVATGHGLIRYDGYETKTYRHDPVDSTSLAGTYVEVVLVDRTGTLWAGNHHDPHGGLNRYDRATDSFTRYRHDPDDPESLSHPMTTSLVEDSEGMLWVGTHGGLVRFDPETETFTRYRHDPDDPNSLSHDQVRVLYEDRQGTLWVGTGSPWHTGPNEGGLNRFHRATGTFTRYLPDPEDPKRLIDGRVSALFEDSRGNFWVGTWGDGLHRMDRETGTFTRFPYDPERPQILSRPHLKGGSPAFSGVSFIHEDRDGMLWIGGFQGGLNRFDPETGTLRHVEHDPGDPQSLIDNTVGTAFESRDGTLWVGTLSGLHRLISPPPRLPQVQLPGDNGLVYSIHEDRTGTVWIGTGRGGLYRFDRASETFTNYRHDPDDPSSLGSGAVDVVYEDRHGILWVGTHGGGLCRFDRETDTFTRFEHDPADSSSLSGNVVHAIHEDRAGRLWIGTQRNGLNLFDRGSGTFMHYQHDPDDPSSLRSNDVRAVFEDAEGRLWVDTNPGLNLFNPETETFSRPQFKTDDPNSCMSELRKFGYMADEEGRLWLAASEGLCRFDPDTGSSFYVTPGNSSLSLRGFLPALLDDEGQLWLASGAHPAVIRLDPEDGTVQVYEAESSNAPWDFSRHRNFKSARAELFIGRRNSFYAFFPDDVEQQLNAHPPQLALHFRFRSEEGQSAERPLRHEPEADSEEVALAHSQNTFSFTFAGLHFKNPAENRYQYRLEGYDEAWRGPGTQREAHYYNVPPGEYVFRVKASNSDGVWTEEGASMAVVVLPPWWRTWWAYVLYGVILVGIITAAAGAQRRHVQQKERERARARELEHAREIEAMNVQLREHETQLESQNAVLEQQKSELEQQRARLVELDAQKSRFFANISHEFRTPLTLILGPLRDALEREVDRDRLAAQAPMMHRNARRLLGLINQLLDFSKLEVGAMRLSVRRLDLVAFLREIVLAFRSRAEREGIALSFSSESDAIPGAFDPDKLEKVVANLLSNAFKFTPSGGKIRVRIEADADDVASITVKDTGRGIPKEELPHVFERFYQVDDSAVRNQEGTGIGLALAKELLELHEGSIDVESEVGFGTAFTIRLPIVAESETIPEETSPETASDESLELYHMADEVSRSAVQERADTEESSAADAAPSDAPVILIVEDNPDMRAYIKSHLEAQYRTIEARNGLEGLELARAHAPGLVLADVMMPKMDGYALCRALKSDPELDHIPVVILTAKSDMESKLEGLETGADDYLEKPFSAEELLVRMENLIELRRRLRDRFGGRMRLGPSDVSVDSEDAAFVREVRDVIEAKISESRFGVGELADEVGLSRRQLQRRLKAAADLSAGAYIRMMRLERAAQLLEQDAGLVSEIAYQVGFKNADHFSRIFQQVFGVPPSQYPLASERDASETG